MKRLLSILLLAVLVVSLASCGVIEKSAPDRWASLLKDYDYENVKYTDEEITALKAEWKENILGEDVTVVSVTHLFLEAKRYCNIVEFETEDAALNFYNKTVEAYKVSGNVFAKLDGKFVAYGNSECIKLFS